MSLNLFCVVREKRPVPVDTRATDRIIMAPSPVSFLYFMTVMWEIYHLTPQLRIYTCTSQLPRAASHSAFWGSPPPQPRPRLLTPTELNPGTYFARSATLPTHTLTLSVPASCGVRFPAFFSRLPPTPKGCESLADMLKHQRGSCVLDGETLTSLCFL